MQQFVFSGIGMELLHWLTEMCIVNSKVLIVYGNWKSKSKSKKILFIVGTL